MKALTTLFFLATFIVLRAEVSEKEVVFAGVKFRVVKATPNQVQVVWKNAQGEPFRCFDAVQSAFSAQGKSVSFLMNAGIFEPGGIPSGLHLEGGINRQPLNLADAPGNFFLKPNGVCALTSHGKPFIGPCVDWQARQYSPHEWAIQSGPLLLIHGKRHPAFTEHSKNKLHRNGVGIDSEGKWVFAITAQGEYVNFWDFSGLFLHLGCKDALFLDGDISQMSVNPPDSVPSNRFGAMFIMTR